MDLQQTNQQARLKEIMIGTQVRASQHRFIQQSNEKDFLFFFSLAPGSRAETFFSMLVGSRQSRLPPVPIRLHIRDASGAGYVRAPVRVRASARVCVAQCNHTYAHSAATHTVSLHSMHHVPINPYRHNTT